MFCIPLLIFHILTYKLDIWCCRIDVEQGQRVHDAFGFTLLAAMAMVIKVVFCKRRFVTRFFDGCAWHLRIALIKINMIPTCNDEMNLHLYFVSCGDQ